MEYRSTVIVNIFSHVGGCSSNNFIERNLKMMMRKKRYRPPEQNYQIIRTS